MRWVPERSLMSEWMDRPDNTAAEIAGALRDIRVVNRYLGGRRTLLDAVRPFLLDGRADRAVEVLDVGTGGADLAREMVDYGRRLDREVRVTAIDRDPHTVRLAAEATSDCPGIRVLRADATSLPFGPGSFDLVTVSMFLHHFDHRGIVDLLTAFRRLARRAVLVNDLRRHRVPWGFIALLARATGRSKMFVHDAPLSVLRGFTASELREAARAAGAGGVEPRRRWPFRLMLTLRGSERA